jgi:HAD superfamily hydrolase (TIGR01490 family)
MDIPKSYIAFFDLDKTILSINSGQVLVREAYKGGLMSNKDLLNAIYLSWLYKFHLRDTSLLITGMGKWLKGLTVEEVSDLSENVVNKYLVDAIRPEIYSEIKIHREQNAEIVILSSVMSDICRSLGPHLGIDKFICTNMEAVDGVHTGFPEKSFCFNDEKRVRLIEYCKIMNYNLGDVYYYGDSVSDIPALEVVGHPVCVVPDKRLKRVANKNGWRICSW